MMAFKNTYSFVKDGVHIVLALMKLDLLAKPKREVGSTLMYGNLIEKKMQNGKEVHVLVVVEELKVKLYYHNPLVHLLLQEFVNLIVDEIKGVEALC